MSVIQVTGADLADLAEDLKRQVKLVLQERGMTVLSQDVLGMADGYYYSLVVRSADHVQQINKKILWMTHCSYYATSSLSHTFRVVI